MTLLFNKTSEKNKRRSLRRQMPNAEVILWQFLKNKQIDGHKFRRQYIVDRYVIDFYCPRKKFAIEVDGPTHFYRGAQQYDIRRQRFIESLGIKVLRITNDDVYQNIQGVIDKIQRLLGNI